MIHVCTPIPAPACCPNTGASLLNGAVRMALYVFFASLRAAHPSLNQPGYQAKETAGGEDKHRNAHVIPKIEGGQNRENNLRPWRDKKVFFMFMGACGCRGDWSTKATKPS